MSRAAPIVFIVSNAFKPPDELFAYPPRFLVSNPTFKNFSDLFTKLSASGVPVSRYLFNSVAITAITVAASIVVSSTAAYALSKKKFRLKQTLFAVNTVALMFVPIAVTIPRFLVIEKLNLLDTFWVHILPVLALPVGLGDDELVLAALVGEIGDPLAVRAPHRRALRHAGCSREVARLAVLRREGPDVAAGLRGDALRARREVGALDGVRDVDHAVGKPGARAGDVDGHRLRRRVREVQEHQVLAVLEDDLRRCAVIRRKAGRASGR